MRYKKTADFFGRKKGIAKP